MRPALFGDKSFQAGFIRDIRERRDIAVSQINAIDGLRCTTPDAAFYLMIRADMKSFHDDDIFVIELLKHAGVLVVPGSGFGSDSRDGYFRMVYLADSEVLGEAINRIRSFVAPEQGVVAVR